MTLSQAQIELARDVMTNAIEAPAINYWTTNVEWERNDGADGEMITQIRLEVMDESTGEPMEPRHVYTVTEETVIEAMRKIVITAEIRSDLHKLITNMWANDDYLAGRGGDAETDDAIIQFATLGKLTFG